VVLAWGEKKPDFIAFFTPYLKKTLFLLLFLCFGLALAFHVRYSFLRPECFRDKKWGSTLAACPGNARVARKKRNENQEEID
jgi:hypothetical protein